MVSSDAEWIVALQSIIPHSERRYKTFFKHNFVNETCAVFHFMVALPQGATFLNRFFSVISLWFWLQLWV